MSDVTIWADLKQQAWQLQVQQAAYVKLLPWQQAFAEGPASLPIFWEAAFAAWQVVPCMLRASCLLRPAWAAFKSSATCKARCRSVLSAWFAGSDMMISYFLRSKRGLT